MNVIVKLKAEVAQTLAKGAPLYDEVTELMNTAREAGVELKQMHPGVRDPSLATYYIADVLGDYSKAEEVASRFRSCKAVEAAYAKPAAELP